MSQTIRLNTNDYEIQQRFLDHLASKYHVIAARPNQHGTGQSDNSVSFYFHGELETQDPFWSCSGRNFDVRTTNWQNHMEGSFLLAFLKRRQYRHVLGTGELFYDFHEADETYNNFNLELLKAYKLLHDQCYIGSINIHDAAKRASIQSGCSSVLEEYVGQHIYNFGCDFVVPTHDSKLEEMIVQWNSPTSAAHAVQVEHIMHRIEVLDGLLLLWL